MAWVVVAVIGLVIGVIIEVVRFRRRHAYKPSPDTITLEPKTQSSGALTLPSADFERAGFAIVGAFAVREMPIELRAFVESNIPAYGVVYLHPIVGSWADVVTRFQNGGGLTTSNSPRAGLMNKLPNKILEPMPGASIPDMIERHRTRIAELGAQEGWRPVPLDASTFVDHFVGAYAEDMAFRRAQGGPTLEEVKRVQEATGSGKNLSEEQLRKATEQMRRREQSRKP